MQEVIYLLLLNKKLEIIYLHYKDMNQVLEMSLSILIQRLWIFNIKFEPPETTNNLQIQYLLKLINPNALHSEALCLGFF